MALIVGFLVAVVATPLAARLATRLGLVDEPGPLKVHAAAGARTSVAWPCWWR